MSVRQLAAVAASHKRPSTSPRSLRTLVSTPSSRPGRGQAPPPPPLQDATAPAPLSTASPASARRLITVELMPTW
ncbi:hypothetical protein HMPREF1549_00808 [Actinomyces johnsonii F0510]|uniref:Uncharacterized protein n=1 Tax=Actinomyces johnsonii F0510 TaxID=1227262 RepID=U1RNB9_9ACTO|nr:hypothetical protein HMPREF1549_00808 [Actinomyces johnsonii F0510]